MTEPRVKQDSGRGARQPEPNKRAVGSMKAWRNLFSKANKAKRPLPRDIKLLRESSLFDPVWYRNAYADLRETRINLARHYLEFGAVEGRDPGPLFSTRFYLDEHPDVATAGLNPLVHYIRYGREEGRRTRESDYDSKSHLSVPTALGENVPEADEAFSPKVSIIVPNYNHARFLPERLESIYNQTYRNFEVILLDDASSDESVLILEQYFARYPDRTIREFNKTNSGGVFYQWKRGLEKASGDLIWIAESDDFCSLDFLAELVRFFRNNAVMLAFSRTDFVLGSPPKTTWTSEAYWSEVGFDLSAQPIIKSAHEVVRSAWGVRNIAPNVSGVLFRNPGKLAILDDPEWLHLRMCGDWVFYLSIIRGGLIGYSPSVTNFYRQHPQNTSIGTHDKPLYYEEHEFTARHVAKLYDVGEDTLRRHEEVLYRHWCMKRGPDARPQFEKLFDIDKVLRGRRIRKPNIAVAVYALVPGGGETFPILIANLLFKRGFGVTVLNFQREKTNPGIKSTLNKAIAIVEPTHSADSGGLLAKLGVELVHSHHAYSDITLIAALRDFPNIRHVVTMHGMYELIDVPDVDHFEAGLRTIDAFVYIADKNLRNFRDEFRRRTSFYKITNTVALPPLSGLSRSDLQIEETEFVLCLASRAIVEKGWQEAVEAVIAANERSKRPIRLLLVGDGPEFERLSRLQLPPSIKLLGFQTNVRDFFAIADAGLITSRFRGESCPLVLIECLSVGKPVIASDVGEVKNMLTANDGLAGVLHTLTDWAVDVPRLTEIILELANDRCEYNRIYERVPVAARKFDQDRMIDRYIDVYANALAGRKKVPGIRLSVVLVVYNMARELKRTIKTFSPRYQHLSASEYEIIVIDNGSRCVYDLDDLHSMCPNLYFSRMETPNQSPVDALNYGISIARGPVICACIDGARMASPNLLNMGTTACEMHPRAVVGSLSFQLGRTPQNESVLEGYDQTVEDALLRTVNWEANGYELFDISCFDPSSRFGLYECPAETNALFMRRELWAECGGFESAFRGKGGGLANLDLWRRLCEDERNLLVMLLGEGTFHQYHGGVSTSGTGDTWVDMHREYMGIRGVEFRVPLRTPYLFGRINPWIAKFERRLDGIVDPEESDLGGGAPFLRSAAFAERDSLAAQTRLS